MEIFHYKIFYIDITVVVSIFCNYWGQIAIYKTVMFEETNWEKPV